MEILELGHLVLYVRNLERSVAFYRDVLGWRQIADGRSNPLPFPAAVRELLQRPCPSVMATTRSDGAPISVEFIARIRGQVRFNNIDALVAQMTDDVDRCRELLRRAEHN